MDSELMQYLLKLVTEVSPEVWAIAKRQVVVNNWMCAFYILLFGSAMRFTISKSYQWYKEDKDMDEMFLAFWVIFVVLLNAVGAIVILEAVQNLANGLLNPDYAALKVLLNLVSK